MSNDVLMFKEVHTNVRNTYHRFDKNGMAATHLPRGNFSDVCAVLSNMFIIDILDFMNVELTVNGDNLHLIFSKKEEVKE